MRPGPTPNPASRLSRLRGPPCRPRRHRGRDDGPAGPGPTALVHPRSRAGRQARAVALASPRQRPPQPDGLARPLAATFTTLGIAGLLLTALPHRSARPRRQLGRRPAGLDRGPDGRQERSGPQRDPASPMTDYHALQSAGSLRSGCGRASAPFRAAAGEWRPKGRDRRWRERAPRTAGAGPPAAGQGRRRIDGGPSPAAEAGDGRDIRPVRVRGAGPPARSRPRPRRRPTSGRPWLLVLSLALLGIGLGLFAARRVGRSD